MKKFNGYHDALARRDVDLTPAPRHIVEIVGAQEAITVQPDQVLVITFPAHTTAAQLEQLRSRLLDSDLRPGQILLVAGALSVAVMPSKDVDKANWRTRLDESLIDYAHDDYCNTYHKAGPRPCPPPTIGSTDVQG